MLFLAMPGISSASAKAQDPAATRPMNRYTVVLLSRGVAVSDDGLIDGDDHADADDDEDDADADSEDRHHNVDDTTEG